MGHGAQVGEKREERLRGPSWNTWAGRLAAGLGLVHGVGASPRTLGRRGRSLFVARRDRVRSVRVGDDKWRDRSRRRNSDDQIDCNRVGATAMSGIARENGRGRVHYGYIERTSCGQTVVIIYCINDSSNSYIEIVAAGIPVTGSRGSTAKRIFYIV